MSEQIKPQFFITRHNGSMVPLIALDELPPTVNIRGTRRQLSPYDICGMTSVGTFESRHQYYIVDGINNTQPVSQPRPAAPVHILPSKIFPRQPTSQAKTYGIEEQPPRGSSGSTPLLKPSVETQDAPNSPNSLPPWHDTADLPLRAAPGTKEYCSYWLRHGECDYAQQGCLYKHEMPLNLDVLKRLGLRDLPRWYREKHGLRSYLTAPSTDCGTVDTKLNNSHRESSARQRRTYKGKPPATRDTTEKHVAKPKNRAEQGDVKMTIQKRNIPGLIRFHPPTVHPAQVRTSYSTTRGRGNEQPSKSVQKTISATTTVSPAPQPTSKESIQEWQLRESLADLGPNGHIEHELEVLSKQCKVSLPPRIISAPPTITATPSSSFSVPISAAVKEMTPSSSAHSTCNEEHIDEPDMRVFTAKQDQDIDTFNNNNQFNAEAVQMNNQVADSAIGFYNEPTILDEQCHPISVPTLEIPNGDASMHVLRIPKEGERDEFYECE